jgi:hypothetical protein
MLSNKTPIYYNDDCPICLREREPYMMRILKCGHRICKEELNVLGVKGENKDCPFCRKPNMIPEPYLRMSLYIPEYNILGLSPEECEDNWNDWRWELYDYLLFTYPRYMFIFETRSDYLLLIAYLVEEFEKKRIKNIQLDEEQRYHRLIELRRILRSKYGYAPTKAFSTAIEIEKGNKKLSDLDYSFFRIPISSASGGRKTKSRCKKRKKQTRKFHHHKRRNLRFPLDHSLL